MKIAIFIATLWGVVAASEYVVEAEGGPSTLPNEVEIAFEAWATALNNPLKHTLEDNHYSIFRFAKSNFFGPDTASITLQGGGSSQNLEIRLHPQLYSLFPGTILHEVGAALGLPAGSGVMSGLISPSSPSEITITDIAAYWDLTKFAIEDLNKDGVVDFYDLTILASSFSSEGINLAADLNSDGTVDRLDLNLLAEVYSFTPPVRDP